MIQCAGGIVYKHGRFVTVTSTKGKTGFTKGHIDRHEKVIDAAYREIREECGLCFKDLVCHGKLGTYHRKTAAGKDKRITLFLFTTKNNHIQAKEDDVKTAQWTRWKDMQDTLTYAADYLFFETHQDKIKTLLHVQK